MGDTFLVDFDFSIFDPLCLTSAAVVYSTVYFDRRYTRIANFKDIRHLPITSFRLLALHPLCPPLPYPLFLPFGRVCL